MAVLIRLALADDAPAICGIYEPYVSGTRITFEEVPPTSEDVRQRMSNPIHPWLVLEEDGAMVGYTSTSPLRARAAYRWSVETGIYLAPSVQGRGWGRLLLGKHLKLLERQGFVSAFAGVALPNDASVAVHQALGFQLSGVERGPGFKLGAWADVARFQKDLAPRDSGFGRAGSSRPGLGLKAAVTGPSYSCHGALSSAAAPGQARPSSAK